MTIFSTHSGVRHIGWQSDVLMFMAMMDVFVLPTYREGLPNVLLEAAALGIPTVTTNATGARDAVVNGETGLVVTVRDAEALKDALLTLAGDRLLRRRMGDAGRRWVSEHFDRHQVWRRQIDEYRALLAAAAN
jgi:glycosyltransferase involved in cell wall biosynthesis